MCVTFFYLDFDANSKSEIPYKLILANNRDETFSRATDVPKWNEKGILCATDLVGGGTWLGATEAGRIANLLNIPDRQGETIEHAPSRGNLVINSLLSKDLYKIDDIECYNGFKLLSIDINSKAATLQSTAEKHHEINYDKGFHSIGNHRDDQPFSKLVHGQSLFQEIVLANSRNRQKLPEKIFSDLLTNREKKIDETLQEHYGHSGDDMVSGISSLFVNCGNVYGTRSQTVILIDCDNNATFVQRELQVPHDEGSNAEQPPKSEEFTIEYKIEK